MIVVLLAACSPVRTADEAPFDIRGKTMLFLADDDSDGLSGAAMLLVTDEELDCDDMPRKGYPDVFSERLDDEGQGLALVVTYTSIGEAEFGRKPWPGLYASAGGVDGEEQDRRIRTLVPRAYDRGFGFLVDANTDGGSWLSIDELEDDVLLGEFVTPWWTGRVDATVCEGGGLGGGVDCSPKDPEAFYDAFLDLYCSEWEQCSDDPCPVSTGGTTGGECPEFDAQAAEACLCGEWTCNSEFPGFAFPEVPTECAFVCGAYF